MLADSLDTKSPNINIKNEEYEDETKDDETKQNDSDVNQDKEGIGSPALEEIRS